MIQKIVEMLIKAGLVKPVAEKIAKRVDELYDQERRRKLSEAGKLGGRPRLENTPKREYDRVKQRESRLRKKEL